MVLRIYFSWNGFWTLRETQTIHKEANLLYHLWAYPKDLKSLNIPWKIQLLLNVNSGKNQTKRIHLLETFLTFFRNFFSGEALRNILKLSIFFYKFSYSSTGKASSTPNDNLRNFSSFEWIRYTFFLFLLIFRKDFKYSACIEWICWVLNNYIYA